MKILENKELFSAICLTVASYLLASPGEVTGVIAGLFILMCAISQWIKVAKKYVNDAIEQKLEESKNKESD